MTHDTSSAGAAAAPGVEGFDVLTLIGTGGFARVYQASEEAFGRQVAIKILSVSSVSDDVLRRFRRECQAVGTLSGHPNIVSVYGTGTTNDGSPFIVMDFMPGGSLRDLIERSGPLDWAQTVELGLQISSAVQAAHDEGILHRDIKPDNILISKYGQAQLADFGISSVPGGFETRTGLISASLTHAAPEVIDGHKATAASDLYSLSSTLVTLILGRPPFARDDDESTAALIARILRDPLPSLSSERVPAKLQHVFERAMAKEPSARYGSASEFAAALGSVRRAAATGRLPVLEPRAAAGLLPRENSPNLAAQKSVLEETGDHTRLRTSGRRREVPPPTAESGRMTQRTKLVALIAAVMIVVLGAGGLAFAMSRHSGKPVAAAAAVPPVKTSYRATCRGFTCSFASSTRVPNGAKLAWTVSGKTAVLAPSQEFVHRFPGPGTYQVGVRAVVPRGTGTAYVNTVDLTIWHRTAQLHRPAGRRFVLVVRAPGNIACRAGSGVLEPSRAGRWSKDGTAVRIPSNGVARGTLPAAGIKYRIRVLSDAVTSGRCGGVPTTSISAPAHPSPNPTVTSPTTSPTTPTPNPTQTSRQPLP